MIMLWKKVMQVVLLSTVFLFSQTDLKNPFLWEASKGSEKFYLFGTIHLADEKLSGLPLVLKNTIDKSDEVRTEVSLDADFQVKSTMHMMRKDGKMLKTLLPSALYERSQEYLKSIHPQLSIHPFEHMKVWGLTVVLTMLENQMKNPTLQAIDMNIYNYAKKMGKGVGGVESIEEQIVAMDMFSLAEQIVDLEATLDYLSKNRDFIDKMKNIYLEGNNEKMITFLEDTMFNVDTYSAVDEKFMQVMLYDRNANMTKRIIENIKLNPKSTYFFAFGVIHFLGEKSIVDKLESQGYSVRRMK